MIDSTFYSEAVPKSFRKEKKISLGAAHLAIIAQKRCHIINPLKFSTHLQGDLGEGRNFLSFRLRVSTGIEGPGRGGHGQRVRAILDPRWSKGGPLRWLTTGAGHPAQRPLSLQWGMILLLPLTTLWRRCDHARSCGSDSFTSNTMVHAVLQRWSSRGRTRCATDRFLDR